MVRSVGVSVDKPSPELLQAKALYYLELLDCQPYFVNCEMLGELFAAGLAAPGLRFGGTLVGL